MIGARKCVLRQLYETVLRCTFADELPTKEKLETGFRANEISDATPVRGLFSRALIRVANSSSSFHFCTLFVFCDIGRMRETEEIKTGSISISSPSCSSFHSLTEMPFLTTQIENQSCEPAWPDVQDSPRSYCVSNSSTSKSNSSS